jgi:tRNA threonylcarbamoyladenosine modification (KEOPS) complex  Pcc1 subunit
MPLLRKQDSLQGKNYCHKSKSNMSFRLILEIDEKKELYDSILPEFTGRKEDRSAAKIEYKDGKLIATVEAKDAVALQATFNSIINLARVHEKVKHK